MNFPVIIGLAIVIEIMTYILRFGYDLHSRTIQKKFKFPVRVHHMYVGAFFAGVGPFYSPQIFQYVHFYGPVYLLDIGLAILLSDVIHHFIVLPAFHQKIDFP